MPIVFNICLSQKKGGLEQMADNYHKSLKKSVYVNIRYRGRFDFIGKWAFNKLLKFHKPDIAFLHGNRAVELTNGHGYKRVAVVHNVRFKPELLKQCTAAIAVSKAIKREIETQCPQLPVFHIPNAIDLPQFQPHDNHTPFTFGFIGRLHARKGVDILIDAMKSHPNAKLLIAGEGEERAALEAKAKGMNVEFLGWVKPQKFFAQIDILIIPSHKEPFGLVAVEAMAAGVPVIAHNIEGLGEIITNTQDGLLYAPNDAKTLAETMSTTIENHMIINARKTAEDKYALPILKRNLEEFLTHANNL